MLTLKYACPMCGKNISPAIAWKGLPARTQRIHLTIEDGVCTWGCDARGKADHWILDFPVSAPIYLIWSNGECRRLNISSQVHLSECLGQA